MEKRIFALWLVVVMGCVNTNDILKMDNALDFNDKGFVQPMTTTNHNAKIRFSMTFKVWNKEKEYAYFYP